MIKINQINQTQFMYQENESEPITLESKFDKKSNKYWLTLPENELNRKCVSVDKIEKNGGELIIDTYKETRKLTKDDNSIKSPKSIKNWVDYLTDDERETYEKLKKICEHRAEKERILREIEALNQKLNELK